MLSTKTTPTAVQPLELVTVTIYSPLFKVVIFVINGFGKLEVKSSGPAHSKIFALVALACKRIDPPSQMVFVDADGFVVGGKIVFKKKVSVVIVQASKITSTLYGP